MGLGSLLQLFSSNKTRSSRRVSVPVGQKAQHVRHVDRDHKLPISHGEEEEEGELLRITLRDGHHHQRQEDSACAVNSDQEEEEEMRPPLRSIFSSLSSASRPTSTVPVLVHPEPIRIAFQPGPAGERGGDQDAVEVIKTGRGPHDQYYGHTSTGSSSSHHDHQQQPYYAASLELSVSSLSRAFSRTLPRSFTSSNSQLSSNPKKIKRLGPSKQHPAITAVSPATTMSANEMDGRHLASGPSGMLVVPDKKTMTKKKKQVAPDGKKNVGLPAQPFLYSDDGDGGLRMKSKQLTTSSSFLNLITPAKKKHAKSVFASYHLPQHLDQPPIRQSRSYSIMKSDYANWLTIPKILCSSGDGVSNDDRSATYQNQAWDLGVTPLQPQLSPLQSGNLEEDSPDADIPIVVLSLDQLPRAITTNRSSFYFNQPGDLADSWPHQPPKDILLIQGLSFKLLSSSLATPFFLQSTSLNYSSLPQKSNTSNPQSIDPTKLSRKTCSRYALADFDLIRTLGTGSFGRVHLSKSRHNGRGYAIKVNHLPFITTPYITGHHSSLTYHTQVLNKKRVVSLKQVEHTNSERLMLAAVRHPFLVNLWGTFSDSYNLYMVMPYARN
ncbi:AGC/PKA protein kinase [Puccinia sorghi]|uniref:cAMP-dependent protein kinase n=1 Tax=Puccinia sorghi TaxID=27349 RepID=A0A0L6VR60_9BASI|nr:AGC/PKA protein kinase [Puccinia sorghi]